MRRKPYIAVFLCFLIAIGTLFLLTAISSAHTPFKPILTPVPTITPTSTSDLQAQVVQAVNEAIVQQRADSLALLIYPQQIEEVHISQDGRWATALLVMVDPQTGQPAHNEPGLVLAKRINGTWMVILPSDASWAESVQEAPTNLLSTEHKDAWLIAYQGFQVKLPSAPLTGYLLPWAAGETRYLSQSVAHDAYTPGGSAHYAFDFYVHDTMWNIYAAKAGTVWRYKIDVPTCLEYTCSADQPLGNYIVLQDTTTNPVSYQLYLHLAYDSIPQALRVTGAPVVQGQFIGIADNTGQSWGDHLHFQVHTNPNSYWGQSVDITFQDVAINGGRPRVPVDLPYCTWPGDVCSQTQSAYISGNVVRDDITPPSGDLLEPTDESTITDPILHLEGWASDAESGLSSAQFIAQFGGSWHNIGDVFQTGLFSLDWDWCADGVPDGPVSLALALMDQDGNTSQDLPGLTHVVKNHSCPPPPPCSPGADQVALYADPDFAGTCLLLGVGDYPNEVSLGALGDDNAASIQVGTGVMATLYSDEDYSGRGETFTAANGTIGYDSNLDDNLIGADHVTSLRVQPREQAPGAPTKLIAPQDGATFAEGASLSLSWRDPGGATRYQARLDGPTGVITSAWLTEPLWHLDALTTTTGTYSWQVRAGNDIGASPWSTSPYTFAIGSPITFTRALSVPFSDDFETPDSGWRSSGLWSRPDHPNHYHSSSHSWYYGTSDGNYDDYSPNTGDLTSPPITLPISSTHYLLRFWYLYQTEGPGTHWDQRWVQVSKDGGPFTNVLQLYDDTPEYWLNSNVDLSAYAGSTIQVRFHFETLDGGFNRYEGWYIDDVDVSTEAYPTCQVPDPAQPVPIAIGETVSGVFCPTGDVDFYTFSGTAGDRIVVDVDTPTVDPPDGLDPVLYLLDGDGTSVLAYNDDEIPGIRTDPHLGYLLTRSGTYFLKLLLWAHPGYGGDDYTYTVHLSTDNQAPQAILVNPPGDIYLPDETLTVTVAATDTLSGISHVELLMHSGNWSTEDWSVLSDDWDGTDGWSIAFDPTSLTEQVGIAFFANVYDWAGNWAGAASWNLGLDRTPPVSSLDTLPANQSSTAVPLAWSSSDNLSGIDHFNLQSKIGNAAWNDILPDPGGTVTQTWFIGDPGNTYGFRMRAADVAGNTETYPTQAETTTNIPALSDLCSAPDDWENDNSPGSAATILAGVPAQIHNFCNPASSDYQDDEDWLRLPAHAYVTYRLSATPLAASSAVILELYASDGTTLLAATIPNKFGQPSSLSWYAEADGDLYLRMRHLDGRVIGNGVVYQIGMTSAYALYLPITGK
jgi:hypothetical protein